METLYRILMLLVAICSIANMIVLWPIAFPKKKGSVPKMPNHPPMPSEKKQIIVDAESKTAGYYITNINRGEVTRKPMPPKFPNDRFGNV